VNDPVFGERYVYQQVNIDEDSLKAIADKTGGLYFRAEDTEGLKKIYDTIDNLEKTQVKMKTYAEYNELLFPDSGFYLTLFMDNSFQYTISGNTLKSEK